MKAEAKAEVEETHSHANYIHLTVLLSYRLTILGFT
jgi:hypothetical protein